MNKIKPLAQDYTKVYESETPNTLCVYSPGITVLENGRLVATIDFGGIGVSELPGIKGERYGQMVQGMVFVSDDKGKTWIHTGDFPYMHARPFAAGKSVYVIGQAHDLMIIRSDDYGQTWTKPSVLTKNGDWHQAPCNVHYANNNVYLVMEKRVYHDIRGWAVSTIAPVLMRGGINSDLTKTENWSFASELVFRDAVNEDTLDFFGVPFFKVPKKDSISVTPGRGCARMGWLETNVVQIHDSKHYWFDETGRTFHLWMRAHTGGTGYAAVAKVEENADGTMTTMLEKVPSRNKDSIFP